MDVIVSALSHKEAYYNSINNMIVKLLNQLNSNQPLKNLYYSRMKDVLIKGDKFCGFTREIDIRLVTDYINNR